MSSQLLPILPNSQSVSVRVVIRGRSREGDWSESIGCLNRRRIAHSDCRRRNEIIPVRGHVRGGRPTQCRENERIGSAETTETPENVIAGGAGAQKTGPRVNVHTIELQSADGLPPLPTMLSWVSDGILVVGMESEMRVYNQWEMNFANWESETSLKREADEKKAGDSGQKVPCVL